MFKSLKISCDEATTICDKNQYGEAALFDKIKLSLHFIHCKFCSLYTKQNTALSKVYKGHSKKCKEIKHCLTTEQKEEIKKNLKV